MYIYIYSRYIPSILPLYHHFIPGVGWISVHNLEETSVQPLREAESDRRSLHVKQGSSNLYRGIL